MKYFTKVQRVARITVCMATGFFAFLKFVCTSWQHLRFKICRLYDCFDTSYRDVCLARTCTGRMLLKCEAYDHRSRDGYGAAISRRQATYSEDALTHDNKRCNIRHAVNEEALPQAGWQ